METVYAHGGEPFALAELIDSRTPHRAEPQHSYVICLNHFAHSSTTSCPANSFRAHLPQPTWAARSERSTTVRKSYRRRVRFVPRRGHHACFAEALHSPPQAVGPPLARGVPPGHSTADTKTGA